MSKKVQLSFLENKINNVTILVPPCSSQVRACYRSLLFISKLTTISLRLIKQENVGVAGGVPSMVTDLTLSTLVGHPLEGLLFGGAPAPDSLVARAREAFPTTTMYE
jgi:hypothetical protein